MCMEQKEGARTVTCPGSRTGQDNAFIRNVLVQGVVYFPTATKGGPRSVHGPQNFRNRKHPKSFRSSGKEMSMETNEHCTKVSMLCSKVSWRYDRSSTQKIQCALSDDVGPNLTTMYLNKLYK